MAGKEKRWDDNKRIRLENTLDLQIKFINEPNQKNTWEL